MKSTNKILAEDFPAIIETFTIRDATVPIIRIGIELILVKNSESDIGEKKNESQLCNKYSL